MTVYGSFTTSEDIRQAVVSHLRTWLPSYLAEVGRQRSTTIPGIRGYTVAITRDQLGNDSGAEYPIVVVTLPGMIDGLDRHGDGTASGLWHIGVGVAVSGVTGDAAAATVSLYGAAVRLILTQHPKTSVGRIVVESEMYEEIAWDASRAIHAVSFPCIIRVNNVMSAINGGLPTPPADPDTVTEWASVEETNISLSNVDEAEDL